MQSQHICNDQVKQRRHSGRILQVGLEIEGGKDPQTVEPRHTTYGRSAVVLPRSSMVITAPDIRISFDMLIQVGWETVAGGRGKLSRCLLGLSSTLALKNNEHGH